MPQPRSGLSSPWASVLEPPRSGRPLSLGGRALLHFVITAGLWGLPGGSDGKESACNAGDLVRSLGGDDPLEEGMGKCTEMQVSGH